MSFTEALEAEVASLASALCSLDAIMRGLNKVPNVSYNSVMVTSKLKKSYRELLSALHHVRGASELAKRTPEICRATLGGEAMFLMPLHSEVVTSLVHHTSGSVVSSALIRSDRAVEVHFHENFSTLHHLLREEWGLERTIGMQPLLLPLLAEEGCSVRVDALSPLDVPPKSTGSEGVAPFSAGFTTCAVMALATKLLRAKERNINDVRVAIFATRSCKWEAVQRLVQVIPVDAIHCICTSRYTGHAADASSESEAAASKANERGGEVDFLEINLIQAGYIPYHSTINSMKTRPSSPLITAGMKPTLIVCMAEDVFNGRIGMSNVDHLIVDGVASHDDIASLGPFYQLRDVVTRGQQDDVSELVSPRSSEILARAWCFRRSARIVVIDRNATFERELRLLLTSFHRDAFKIVCSTQSRLYIDGVTVIPKLEALPQDVDELVLCEVPPDAAAIASLLDRAAARAITFCVTADSPLREMLEVALQAKRVPFTVLVKYSP